MPTEIIITNFSIYFPRPSKINSTQTTYDTYNTDSPLVSQLKKKILNETFFLSEVE